MGIKYWRRKSDKVTIIGITVVLGLIYLAYHSVN